MKEFRKRLWLEVALCTSFLSFFHTLCAYTSDGSDDLLAALSNKELAAMQKDTYTINFNNIAMIEFLRFASKLTNLNFVFDETDMQFTVSVISEEPVTAKNVMAVLAQVLRIHDLIILEQDGNVLLTKSTKVNMIPPIVSADVPDAPAPNALIVTRVFRIKNANANTVASIIRPMTSSTALIEVSNETRQLIVTDIATNVEQIAALLLSIDSPHSPLDIDTYIAKTVPPDELIALATQILNPFTEGNPLIFVPQKDTNSIFIVSTPHLIERAISIMEDLDIPAKNKVLGKGAIARNNVYVYKVQNRSLEDLRLDLKGIIAQMKERGVKQTGLEQAIKDVEEATDTNSLIFLADDETIGQLKDILTALDTSTTTKMTLFIYKILSANETQITTSLHQIREEVLASPRPDVELVKAIDSLQWNKEINGLIFIGTPGAIDKLKELLPTFDTTAKGQKSTFLIYTPQYRNGEDLYSYLKATANNLKDSGFVNSAFMQTLNTMKWTSSTNSLLFTGDPDSLERVQSMLTTMDTATFSSSKTTDVFIYKPQYATPDQIQSGLQELIPSLKKTNTYADQNLIKAIQSLQWNSDIQSFIVTADPSTVTRIKALLAVIDGPQQITTPLTQTFYLYKLKNAEGDIVIDELQEIAKKLPTATLQNQKLIDTINKIEWVRSNNSILITGSPDSIEQIKTLIADFDDRLGPSAAQAFFVYKPQFLPAEEIKDILSDMATDLQKSGLKDPQLLQTLETMRYVPATSSLLFTGTEDTFDKIKTLLATIDNSSAVAPIQSIGNTTFLLYKLQIADPEEFMKSMKTFAGELKKSNLSDKQLADAIGTMKYIKENNSVLFTGTEDALKRIEDVVLKFDIPSASGVTVARAPSTFVIYNPKYLKGEELIAILCEFMNNLMQSGVNNPHLFDTINNLKWIPKTSSMLISGEQASIDQVQGLLARFDVPNSEELPSIETIENTSFLVYKLQFHSGVDIQVALKQIAANLAKGSNPSTALAEAIESMQWIEPTNSLLSTGQQDILVKLKELIQNIDVPLRQVFIELLAIETDVTNIQNFGLQWGSQVQYFNKTILQTGNFPVSSSSGTQVPVNLGPVLAPINATTTPNNLTLPFSSGFDLGVVGDIIMHKGKSFISLGSLVNALQSDNDTTVVLNQKIITQDNRQSTIFVGQNIPYTGSLVSNITSNTTTTANIEYRDVGVNLTITPMLGENNVITLDLVQDISSVVGGPTQTSTTSVTGITTNHTHMETRVHIPDDKFLVLSGMINDSKNHFRTAIPCLGSLPVVGALFSENDRLASKVNVVIFVRAKIVDTFDEYKQITEHQEWLFKDAARLPVLKEEFDDGIDLVKKPEDE